LSVEIVVSCRSTVIVPSLVTWAIITILLKLNNIGQSLRKGRRAKYGGVSGFPKLLV